MGKTKRYALLLCVLIVLSFGFAGVFAGAEVGKPGPEISGQSWLNSKPVKPRYWSVTANAAKDVDPGLCLPVNYDKTLLKVVPAEIIEKDYGCGDPSTYVQ